MGTEVQPACLRPAWRLAAGAEAVELTPGVWQPLLTQLGSSPWTASCSAAGWSCGSVQGSQGARAHSYFPTDLKVAGLPIWEVLCLIQRSSSGQLTLVDSCQGLEASSPTTFAGKAVDYDDCDANAVIASISSSPRASSSCSCQPPDCHADDIAVGTGRLCCTCAAAPAAAMGSSMSMSSLLAPEQLERSGPIASVAQRCFSSSRLGPDEPAEDSDCGHTWSDLEGCGGQPRTSDDTGSGSDDLNMDDIFCMDDEDRKKAPEAECCPCPGQLTEAPSFLSLVQCGNPDRQSLPVEPSASATLAPPVDLASFCTTTCSTGSPHGSTPIAIPPAGRRGCSIWPASYAPPPPVAASELPAHGSATCSTSPCGGSPSTSIGGSPLPVGSSPARSGRPPLGWPGASCSPPPSSGGALLSTSPGSTGQSSSLYSSSYLASLCPVVKAAVEREIERTVVCVLFGDVEDAAADEDQSAAVVVAAAAMPPPLSQAPEPKGRPPRPPVRRSGRRGLVRTHRSASLLLQEDGEDDEWGVLHFRRSRSSGDLCTGCPGTPNAEPPVVLWTGPVTTDEDIDEEWDAKFPLKGWGS